MGPAPGALLTGFGVARVAVVGAAFGVADVAKETEEILVKGCFRGHRPVELVYAVGMELGLTEAIDSLAVAPTPTP